MSAPTPPARGHLRLVPFDAPEDVAVTFDARLRYTSVTEEAAATLGKPREALLGRRCWDIFPECEQTALGALMREVVLTRMSGNVRAPVHGSRDQDIIAHALPTPDGGIRLVFRFVTRSSMPIVTEPMTGTR